MQGISVHFLTNTVIFLLSFHFLYITSATAEGMRLTPQTVVGLALSQSPTMAAAAANVAAMQAQLDAANRAGRPKVSLDGKTQYGSGESTSFYSVQGMDEPDASITKTSGGYLLGTLSVVVPIYEKGSFLNHDSPIVASATGGFMKSRWKSEVQAIDLVNKVVKAYWGALQYAEEERLQQQLYNSLSQQMGLVNQRIRGGIALPSEQVALEASIASCLANLHTAQRKKTTQLVQLRMMLGMTRDTKTVLEELPDQFPDLPPLEMVLDEAITNHPQIKVQQAEVEIAKAAWGETVGKTLPTVSFSSSANLANGLEDSSNRSFYSLGINLNLPLADFGQSSAEVAAKAHLIRESEEQLALLKDTLTSDIISGYHALLDAKEMLVAKEARFKQAKFEEEYIRILYERGLANMDKLVKEEDNTLSAQLEVMRTRYLAWATYADLHKIAGKLYTVNRLAGGA